MLCEMRRYFGQIWNNFYFLNKFLGHLFRYLFWLTWNKSTIHILFFLSNLTHSFTNPTQEHCVIISNKEISIVWKNNYTKNGRLFKKFFFRIFFFCCDWNLGDFICIFVRHLHGVFLKTDFLIIVYLMKNGQSNVPWDTELKFRIKWSLIDWNCMNA